MWRLPIYRHEEGERLRVGVGVNVKAREIFLAVPTTLGPRPRLAWIGLCLWGGRNRIWEGRGIILRLDFFRDHAMHIPNDVDGDSTLCCRRCEKYSGSPINQYCGGFMVSRDPGSRITISRGWRGGDSNMIPI